jgi:plasmid stabilization system protein ParE
MRHKVELSLRAQGDIDSTYRRIRDDAPGRAARWRQRLLDAVDSLEHFPLRHALAPEAEAVGMELRQMMFGVYRVLYVVEGDTINILTVRHGARQLLTPSELGRGDD